MPLIFPTLCDGFGMVATEAWSQGTPVITTMRAGASDLLRDGENGLLVEAASADDIERALQRCLDNPKLLSSMRESSLATAASVAMERLSARHRGRHAMTKPKRICLVSPGHVSANPRLVKEADALSEAGYEVHVVAGRYFPVLDANDQAILTDAKWICHRVDYSSGLKAMADKAARRILRGPAAALARNSLLRAGAAHHAAVPRLAQAARRVDADLIIGHCLAGLAAAAIASDHNRSQLAFDAEDFHSDRDCLRHR